MDGLFVLFVLIVLAALVVVAIERYVRLRRERAADAKADLERTAMTMVDTWWKGHP